MSPVAASDEQNGAVNAEDGSDDNGGDEGVAGPLRTHLDGHTRESSVALRERGKGRARLTMHRLEPDPASTSKRDKRKRIVMVSPAISCVRVFIWYYGLLLII